MTSSASLAQGFWQVCDLLGTSFKCMCKKKFIYGKHGIPARQLFPHDGHLAITSMPCGCEERRMCVLQMVLLLVHGWIRGRQIVHIHVSGIVLRLFNLKLRSLLTSPAASTPLEAPPPKRTPLSIKKNTFCLKKKSTRKYGKKHWSLLEPGGQLHVSVRRGLPGPCQREIPQGG